VHSKEKKIDDIIIFFSGLHITYSTGVPISFEHRVHPRPRLNIAVEFTHTHTHTQTDTHTNVFKPNLVNANWTWFKCIKIKSPLMRFVRVLVLFENNCIIFWFIRDDDNNFIKIQKLTVSRFRKVKLQYRVVYNCSAYSSSNK